MSKPLIHPTAIIEEGAEIGKNVKIGPYTIVGPNVKIGDGCDIHSHVKLDGHLTMGENNTVYHCCLIGASPQDLSYRGELTRVIIGSGNTFREFASIHRGTLKEKGETIIGNDSLLMAYVHLAHDVVLGDKCVLANSVNLAGHVKIGNRVIVGGGTNIAQFCRLGNGAYIGGASAIDRDIPHFCTAVGNRIKLKGVNIIGMRRQGFEKNVITEVVDFYRIMESELESFAIGPRSFVDKKEIIDEFKHNETIMNMVAFIKESKIGIANFS